MSERSQTQKSLYCMITFIKNSRKSIVTENRSVITWGLGSERRD